MPYSLETRFWWSSTLKDMKEWLKTKSCNYHLKRKTIVNCDLRSWRRTRLTCWKIERESKLRVGWSLLISKSKRIYKEYLTFKTNKSWLTSGASCWSTSLERRTDLATSMYISGRWIKTTLSWANSAIWFFLKWAELSTSLKRELKCKRIATTRGDI